MGLVIVENVRGKWVVDEDSVEKFVEEGFGYGDGALIELNVIEHRGLCCRPNSPAVCTHRD